MRGRSRLLLVALAVSLFGCYTSEHPLDASPALELDAALLGGWRCLPAAPSASDQAATLIVSRARERVYRVRLEAEGEAPELYEAYASRLGSRTLLNVRDMDEGRPPARPWVFVRYALLRPTLLAFEVAQDKALAGVDDAPAALRAAFERLADAPGLFAGGCVCARIDETR
jgi:hypothetical protein